MKKLIPAILFIIPTVAAACPICLPAITGWLGMHAAVIAEVGTAAYAANQVIALGTTVERDIKPASGVK